MQRVNLLDSISETIEKMADNNPGAVLALMELFHECERIDPQDFNQIEMFQHLDALHMYGACIYNLWDGTCKREARKFRLLLRSSQLGFVSRDAMDAWSEGETYGGPTWAEVDEFVCGELDGFLKKEA